MVAVVCKTKLVIDRKLTHDVSFCGNLVVAVRWGKKDLVTVVVVLLGSVWKAPTRPCIQRNKLEMVNCSFILLM